MEKVYLESSYISYLVSEPSDNLIVAAHQELSNLWWKTCRDSFDCVISEAVLREISVGDPDEITKRLDAVKDTTSLSANEEAEY